jgi:hypothetical protein
MCRLPNAGAFTALILTLCAACAESTGIPTPSDPPSAAVVVGRGQVACTVPDDYVVIKVITSDACGRALGRALVVDLPRRTDVVCSGLPAGFVVVEKHGATLACNPWASGQNFASTIKLPGREESVCTTLAVIPGIYTISETVQSPSCGRMGYGWQHRSRVRWTRKNAATTPIGNIEGITGTTVYGWICQPDHPALNTEVHLYANAPSPTGKAFAAFRTRLSAEAAVADRCNGQGTYRFRHQLTPAQLRQLSPGRYQVYAHAIDFDGGPHPVIGPARTLVVPR